MNTEQLITIFALSSMSVGGFLFAINTTISNMLGGLAFGFGFATITTQTIAKLESFNK
ncbi:MAG: hypothetical protein IKQ31_01805 [Clostridia bacterium]|nr:hypothetical protein [Clostridia bacterium]